MRTVRKTAPFHLSVQVLGRERVQQWKVGEDPVVLRGGETLEGKKESRVETKKMMQMLGVRDECFWGGRHVVHDQSEL